MLPSLLILSSIGGLVLAAPNEKEYNSFGNFEPKSEASHSYKVTNTRESPAPSQYDDSSREPYSYRYNVADPETNNNYEMSETGNPDIVNGSYRIALSDGRTQVVDYQVHPEKGYTAKVSYEGTAKYSDVPEGYIASDSGPLEPIRKSDKIFKRQSPPPREPKNLRLSKANRSFTLHKENTVNLQQVGEGLVNINNDLDLTESSSNIVTGLYKETSIAKNTSKNTKISKNIDKPTKLKLNKKHKIEKTQYELFDDTQASPVAEPISLQQSYAPRRSRFNVRPSVSQNQYARDEYKAILSESNLSSKPDTKVNNNEEYGNKSVEKLNKNTGGGNQESTTPVYHITFLSNDKANEEAQKAGKAPNNSPNVISFGLLDDIFEDNYDIDNKDNKIKRKINMYTSNNGDKKINTFIKKNADGYLNVKSTGNEVGNKDVLTSRIPVYTQQIDYNTDNNENTFHHYQVTTLKPKSLPPKKELTTGYTFQEATHRSPSHISYNIGGKPKQNLDFLVESTKTTTDANDTFEILTNKKYEDIVPFESVEQIDQDYVEDYNSFPIGLRLPSIILPENNIDTASSRYETNFYQSNESTNKVQDVRVPKLIVLKTDGVPPHAVHGDNKPVDILVPKNVNNY